MTEQQQMDFLKERGWFRRGRYAWFKPPNPSGFRIEEALAAAALPDEPAHNNVTRAREAEQTIEAPITKDYGEEIGATPIKLTRTADGEALLEPWPHLMEPGTADRRTLAAKLGNLADQMLKDRLPELAYSFETDSRGRNRLTVVYRERGR